VQKSPIPLRIMERRIDRFAGSLIVPRNVHWGGPQPAWLVSASASKTVKIPAKPLCKVRRG
jgi:hypothetical protein